MNTSLDISPSESKLTKKNLSGLLLVICSDVTKRAFMDKYEESIAPFTKGRGIDWEIQISECDVSCFSIDVGDSMFNCLFILFCSVYCGTRMECHLPCLIQRERNCGKRKIRLYRMNDNARIFE